MEFSFDTPLLETIKKVSDKERSRTLSEGAESGFYSAPATPCKFSSSGESLLSPFSYPGGVTEINEFFAVVPPPLSSGCELSLSVVVEDLSAESVVFENPDAGPFALPPSPFVPLGRQLTPYENFAVWRLAQRLADHRQKFRLINFDTGDSDVAPTKSPTLDGAELPEGHVTPNKDRSSAYSEMSARMKGVLGRSAKGVSSDVAWIPKNRRQKNRKNIPDYCTFCKNNEETRCREIVGKTPDELLWTDHRLKDLNGRCTCPVLRMHVCEYCGDSGDKAHTIRYCTKKKDDYMSKGRHQKHH